MKRTLSITAGAAVALGMLTGPASAASPADFSAAPHIVRDATAGAGGTSFINDSAILGNRLVYSYQGTSGAELWISDGTSAGTHAIKDIWPGVNGSKPESLTTFNGKVFFSARTSAADRELWATDGTAAGTQRVKDIWPGTSGSYPDDFVVAGGWLYFGADDGATGTELWRTTGNATTTHRVADLNPGAFGSAISNTVAWGSKIVFRAGTGAKGNEPWVSDGTAAGTHMVGDLAAGAASSNPFGFTSFIVGTKSQFAFTARDNIHGYEMWISNGTTSSLVKDINPGLDNSASPRAYTRYGNRLIFSAGTDAQGTELWSTDGTSIGTVLVKDINTVPTDSGISGEEFTAFRSKIYFTATDSTGDTEPWVTQGTAATTHVVKNLSPGTSSSYPSRFMPSGDWLFFSAGTPATGDELWQSDGTLANTRLLKDLRPGPDHSYVTPLASIGNTLFFEAQESHGEELWAYTTRASATKGVNKTVSKKTAAKRRIRVTVKVRASGTTPIGKVTLKKGSRIIGEGHLKNGTTRIRITRKLGKGTHKVKAYYAGSLRARTSHSGTIRIRVK